MDTVGNCEALCALTFSSSGKLDYAELLAAALDERMDVAAREEWLYSPSRYVYVSRVFGKLCMIRWSILFVLSYSYFRNIKVLRNKIITLYIEAVG